MRGVSKDGSSALVAHPSRRGQGAAPQIFAGRSSTASVGRNKRSALRRRRGTPLNGAMRCAYCALPGVPDCASLHPGYETALRPGQIPDDAGEKNFRIPYPRPPNLPYPDRVLSDEGALSRGDPSADRAKAGRTGAPRNGRRPGGRWSAGRRCALPWARAVALPREVGSPPASKGAHWCPGASHRSIPSLGFARDWQTSDALRRENARAWLFELSN